jgi:hypothetical protein
MTTSKSPPSTTNRTTGPESNTPRPWVVVESDANRLLGEPRLWQS